MSTNGQLYGWLAASGALMDASSRKMGGAAEIDYSTNVE
jgi:hypothetical protein